MNIRKYRESDAETISKLVCRNLLEINSREYGIENMKKFADSYNADKIRKVASKGNMYIACEDEKIIGCGAIAYENEEKTESAILTVFILPEYHKKGIGAKIIKTLENDEIFINSKKTTAYASLTANIFYEKMGYKYRNNKKEIIKSDHYIMEKIK